MSAVQMPSQLGEADVARVRTLLKVASEPDSAGATGRRKAADDALQKATFIPGFMAVLQTIFGPSHRHDTPQEIRFLAVVCAKNILQRHWSPRPRRLSYRRRGSGGGNGAAGNSQPQPPPLPPAPVSEAEKARFKATILPVVLTEPDQLVALHLALLVSLMVRVDVRAQGSGGLPRLGGAARSAAPPSSSGGCGGGGAGAAKPPFWPELFKLLVAGLSDSSDQRQVIVLNSARALMHAVREFSSMKISVHQVLFRQHAAQILPPVLAAFQSWASHALRSLTAVQQLPARVAAADITKKIQDSRMGIQLSLFAAKTLRMCIVRGCPQLAADSPAVHSFFSLVLPLLKQLNGAVVFLESLCARSEFAGLDSIRNYAAELLDNCVSTVTEAHTQHTASFVPYLPTFLQLFTKVCMGQIDASSGECTSASAGSGESIDSSKICNQLHIMAVLFVAQVFDNRFYHPVESSDGSPSLGVNVSAHDAHKSASQARGVAIVRSMFTQDFQTKLLQVCIVRHMKLTHADLEDWASDGEVFVQSQSDMEHAHCLRSASEHLVLSIADRNPKAIQGVVSHLLQASVDWQLPAAVRGKPSDMCLTLDAVLAAYGVCFYQLQDIVKFAPWLAQSGLRYLNVSPKTHPASEVSSLDQRIIQRRVLWLVKCCLYPLQPSAHARLYQPVLLALQSPDCVVSIEAAATLHAMVENGSMFQLEAFAPHAKATVHALVRNVFARCTELSTGEAVLELVRAIIDRLGAGTRHIASEFLGPLPALWKKCEEMNVLRPQVLQIVDACIDNLDGQDALTVAAKVVPLVKFALNPKQAEFHILAGPGMALWRSMMRASPSYDSFFHALFPCIRRVLEFSLEHVFIAMGLVKSYVLLGGAAFLKVYADEVAKLISMVHEESRDGDVDACVSSCVDVVATCFPVETCTFLHGPLSLMVRAVCSKTGHLHVRLGHMSVLARLLACAPGPFFQILGRIAADASPVKQRLADPKAVANDLFLKLLDLWLDNVDCIGHNVQSPLRQKVWALALCRTLGAKHPGIVERIPLVLNAVASVLMDSRSQAATAADLGQYLIDRIPSTRGSLSATLRGRRGAALSRGRSDGTDRARGQSTTSPEAKRWHVVLGRDFVHAADLASEVRKAVAQCRSALGASQVDKAVAKAEASTLAVLRGRTAST